MDNVSLIRPIPGRRDWFFAPRDLVQPIFGASGIGIEPARCRIHRTHLPLLDCEDAQRLLHVVNNDPAAWAQRDVETDKLGFKLRTTQQQGIDFIAPRRGALIGDDMRVGKTLTALMSHDPARGPLVVCAPLQTRGVWLGWMRRLFPGEEIGIVTGRKFDPTVLKHQLIFIHYDVIRDWQAPFKIGTLIFDEAHFLTNHKSKRSNAAVFHASNAEKVIAMTGTPIWNMPPDLWNVLGLVEPGGFGDYYSFCMRYGLPVHTGYGVDFTGVSNEDELRKRINEVMLRRRWVDVADDIPPITRSVVVATIDDKARRKLDIIAAKLQSERTDKSTTVGNLASYRQQLSLFKIPTVLAEVRKALDANEPIVVWTWHVELAQKIAAELPGSYLIHGEIPAAKRDEHMAAWKAECKAGTPRVLIATMSVAQVGIDLSAARLALFAEVDYTPAVIAQTEMRTFDPTRGMNVTFVVADHIIDQRIVRALIGKLGAANPLGVGAAIDAIDALRTAMFGTPEEADLGRLLDDLLADAA